MGGMFAKLLRNLVSFHRVLFVAVFPDVNAIKDIKICLGEILCTVLDNLYFIQIIKSVVLG